MIERARELRKRLDKYITRDGEWDNTIQADAEIESALVRHALEARLDEAQKYEPMKEALQQFMKATLRIANDAAQIVTLRLPCHCDAQDGTSCTRCNVIREIKALAEQGSKGNAAAASPLCPCELCAYAR
jgi:hypothetical protein